MKTLQKYYSLGLKDGAENRRDWLRQIIVEEKIYLSLHHELDDKSEFSPHLDFRLPTDSTLEMFPAIKNELMNLLDRSGLRDTEIQQIKERVANIDLAALMSSEAQQQKVLEVVKEIVKERVRIYSFSMSPFKNIECLWQDYADRHMGIRIDFSREKIEGIQAEGLAFAEVGYRNKRLATIPFSDERFLEDFIRPVFLMKDAKWQEQEEWRLVKFLETESPYLDLPKGAIEQIVLGRDISEADGQFVHQLVVESGCNIAVIQEGAEQFIVCGYGISSSE